MHSVLPRDPSAESHQALEQANALSREGRLEAALELYGRAASGAPQWHLPHFNAGILLLRLGRDEEAMLALLRSVDRKPDCWKSQFNLALLYLRHGRFAEGWRRYDWRFQAGGHPAVRTGRQQPLWDGRRLDGETVLLCAEQGLGDVIQFLRFAPAVQSRGARLLLECPAPLRTLVEDLPFLAGTVDPTETCNEAHYQFPLMSVPRLLAERFEPSPLPFPYLKAPPPTAGSAHPLLALGDRKIGIVWTGDPDNPFNPIRSCRPEDFHPLTRIPKTRLYSLQYQDGGISPEALSGKGIASLGSALGDFAQTAALLHELDLVITVDTALAHLAGALGRETWLLLSSPCDWRWSVEGSTTPWYPNLRLFRQERSGDWAELFERVARALAHGDDVSR